MTSIILMAVGILMIMCPAQYIDALVSALGYGMLILAAVMVLDFISSKKVLMNYIYLTGALILALLGIAVLVFGRHRAGHRHRVRPGAVGRRRHQHLQRLDVCPARRAQGLVGAGRAIRAA